MKAKTLLFLIIHLSVFNINAQSLSESLGAVKTNFHIFSDTKDLNVSDQFIIKRAEEESQTGVIYDGGYGYGYGYRITSYNVCYTKLLRSGASGRRRPPSPPAPGRKARCRACTPQKRRCIQPGTDGNQSVIQS